MENEDLSSPAPAPVAAAPAEAPAAAAAPVAPQFDPRRRIRELLSIPERDRSDAEWDELNELEIQTAPGNRLGNQPPMAYAGKPAFHQKNRMKGKGGGGGGGGGGKPGGPGGRPQGKPHNKPRPA